MPRRSRRSRLGRPSSTSWRCRRCRTSAPRRWRPGWLPTCRSRWSSRARPPGSESPGPRWRPRLRWPSARGCARRRSWSWGSSLLPASSTTRCVPRRRRWSVTEHPSGPVLAGCVIAVTADRRFKELAAALERRGATVEHAPALEVVPHLDDESLVESTRAILANPPDVVVATTGIGFRGWIEAADAVGLADELLDVLGAARLIARGPKARGAIEAAGLTADWVATSETAAEIQQFLLAEGVAGLRIAVQHHGSGADGLDEAFAEAGAIVAGVVVYSWGPSDPDVLAASVRKTADGLVDAVVFTSAPGVVAWLAMASDEDLVAIRRHNLAGRLVLATVGPVTAAPLEDAGLQPLVPTRWRLGAVVRELVTHYAGQAPIETVAG